MIRMVKNLAKRALRRSGYDTVWYNPHEISAEERDIIDAVRRYTMTSEVRIHALIRATKYLVKSGIPGDIVECGVWKGGSIMSVAHTLLSLGTQEPRLYLFDTFEGMPQPGERDASSGRADPRQTFRNNQTGVDRSDWCYASLQEVRSAVYSTGYDRDRFVFVKGKVEDTIPEHAPESISLLRLDTDFYESTRHELEHLFPRLSRGGALIIDDYGAWQGAQRAVDEYIEQHELKLFLNRIDHTARIGIKI